MNISSILLSSSRSINIYFGSFLWLGGNIGCIGNIIVFSSISFRNQAYSIYLLFQSIINLFYFNFILLTRILQEGFQISLTNSSNILCKFRQFSSEYLNMLSFTLFSFATIDRILSIQRSNSKLKKQQTILISFFFLFDIVYRQWSNRRCLAYKIIIISILFWLIIFGHRLIYYTILNGKCKPLSGFYLYFDNYFEVFICSICPSLIMCILAYLLIKNIRYILKKKIIPLKTKFKSSRLKQQIDFQITLMLILESSLIVLTYIPFGIELIYSNITKQINKSILRISWEIFFIQFIRVLSYIFFASSFYLSFITNGTFRREFRRFFKIK